MCCAARSEFGRRAEPERSEGGWSEAQRSGAKWRGRGLGQRNIYFFLHFTIKKVYLHDGIKPICRAKLTVI